MPWSTAEELPVDWLMPAISTLITTCPSFVDGMGTPERTSFEIVSPRLSAPYAVACHACIMMPAENLHVPFREFGDEVH